MVGTLKFEVKGARAADITPVGIAMTRDGKRAFVGAGPANHVAFVDVASAQGDRTWCWSASAPGTSTLDKAEARLCVVNGLSDDVTVVDVAGAKAIKTRAGRPRALHGW